MIYKTNKIDDKFAKLLENGERVAVQNTLENGHFYFATASAYCANIAGTRLISVICDGQTYAGETWEEIIVKLNNRRYEYIIPNTNVNQN